MEAIKHIFIQTWQGYLINIKYFMVDQNMGPLESLSHSFNYTGNYVWTLVGMFFVMWGFNIVGAMLLGVGMLITLPMSLVIMALMYKELLLQNTPLCVLHENSLEGANHA